MTFGLPIFLIAAVAAAIPVVLHMINRQKAKDLPFSTLRFLQVSVQKTRRRKRVHDILLMLIRAAVLILIAIALAKPAVTNLKSLFGGANSAVVIILDNSASMGTIDNDRVRFETALGAATQIMDELRDGDQVALLLTGGPAFPEQDKLDRTHEKVRQMLAASKISYSRADLGVKVHQARKLLSKSKAPNKQIFVISDMQDLSWEGFSQNQGQKPKEAESTDEETEELNIPVIFVDCNRTPRPNVAVRNVKLEAPVPVAGLPIKAVVELFNTSQIAQQRHLELFVDGKKTASSPVLNIPAEGVLKHEFQFSFKTGGLHRGEVRLVGEDGSEYDDRRYFTMEVDQGIPVAIVKSQPHEIPYLEDTFYLQQALAPTGSGGWAIRTTNLTAAQLIGEQLSAYTVIYCVNLPALPDDAAKRLRTYVENGGNLVWICGNNVDPEAYNQMDKQQNNHLLPTQLLEVRTPALEADHDSWNITFLDKTHPAFEHLVEPSSLYQSILVYKHVCFDENGDVSVLARLRDGEALLTQRKVEKGTVTMLGTSVHVDWTNLPLRPIFLPLFARLTFELAGTKQRLYKTLAGTPLALQFEDGIHPTTIEIRPPSGEMIRLEPKSVDGRPAKMFSYARTHDIGIYMLQLLGLSRPQRIPFSVNVDPDESNPKKIEREELEKRFAPTPLVFAENPDDLTSTFEWLRKGKSLWTLFLSGVLLALVCETFLSNRLSPKQDEEELKKIPPGMRRLAQKGKTA